MNLWNMIQWSDVALGDKYYLFNDIKLPSGIDKEVLINTILDKCATQEPLHHDADLMKSKIENLFLKNYDIYTRLVKAFNSEYDPLSNYDRTELTEDNSTSNVDSENKVSAFDSDVYQNNGQVLTNSGGTNVRRSKISGNIGVTTSQQMLESELKVRPKLNIYEVIANDFYNELMLYIL